MRALALFLAVGVLSMTGAAHAQYKAWVLSKFDDTPEGLTVDKAPKLTLCVCGTWVRRSRPPTRRSLNTDQPSQAPLDPTLPWIPHGYIIGEVAMFFGFQDIDSS